VTREVPGSVVVTVGEELLSGATLDRNAAWISSRLGDIGVPVWRSHSVGDREADIAEVVGSAAGRSPFVVVTGGLGPTADDRTRDAVAGALGVELVEDPSLLRHLEDRYRAAGRGALPPAMRALALCPVGGRPLPNPVGAAPGLAFVSPSQSPGWIVLLPGVPREMRAIFPAVEELAASAFGSALRPVRSRTIHTTGIPESQLAPMVEEALGDARRGLEVAYLPDLLGVDLRLTARVEFDHEGETGAQRLLDRGEASLQPILSGHAFVAPSGDLVEATMARLEERGWTFATAESCTGGLVAQRYTAREGASRTFLGGIVAYANEVKEGWLGVAASVLREHGAVSEAVAHQMAVGACERFGADCSISITGIAGPGGGSEEKPVGTVWIAACRPGPGDGPRLVVARRYALVGDREAVRVRAAQAALHLLFTELAMP
jgi:nicotinamide-nucleotide amidase